MAIHPTFPINFLAELIETDNEAIKIASRPHRPLVGNHFDILNQIQTKANCEAKKLRSKLIYLAS